MTVSLNKTFPSFLVYHYNEIDRICLNASAVKRPLMMLWVLRSIPLGGPIKLFHVPTNATKLV